MERIRIHTSKRVELVDITEKIQQAVTKSMAEGGICVVFCPHTTAGLTINENADFSVRQDMVAALNALVPADAGYAHGEGNSDSHIKSSFYGASLSIIVEKGQLALGRWQGVYFCESDGPRSREVWVTTAG
ncbi:MAG: secondary thiamine-phosphate synthase enzyme YjbQ [Candidatus Omnitrophica bacterium]|nr:secondary thiamine-phosphate synthase enzyme YjbQ [Candidatus Omnitrophota bacterium]